MNMETKLLTLKYFLALLIGFFIAIRLLKCYADIKREKSVSPSPNEKAYHHLLTIYLLDKTVLPFHFYSNYPHTDIGFFMASADMIEQRFGRLALYQNNLRTEINPRLILFMKLETAPINIPQTSSK